MRHADAFGETPRQLVELARDLAIAVRRRRRLIRGIATLAAGAAFSARRQRRHAAASLPGAAAIALAHTLREIQFGDREAVLLLPASSSMTPIARAAQHQRQGERPPSPATSAAASWSRRGAGHRRARLAALSPPPTNSGTCSPERPAREWGGNRERPAPSTCVCTPPSIDPGHRDKGPLVSVDKRDHGGRAVP